MRVVVIGGTGSIGSAVAERLARRGDTPIAAGRTAPDRPAAEALVRTAA